MRLVVFGAGYVGLVTGTGLSDLGHEVLVYDIDPLRIAQLREGKIPIYEPGLPDLIRRNQRNGRLTFTSQLTPPYDEVDAYFIAVGTQIKTERPGKAGAVSPCESANSANSSAAATPSS